MLSPHHNHFTARFPGPPGWAGARRKLLLDFIVLGRITRGRHTDNPGGRHSIRTNQQSTSINPTPPPLLRRMPFLPQPSEFILAWERHRNMLDCILPWLGLQCNATEENMSSACFRSTTLSGMQRNDLHWPLYQPMSDKPCCPSHQRQCSMHSLGGCQHPESAVIPTSVINTMDSINSSEFTCAHCTDVKKIWNKNKKVKNVNMRQMFVNVAQKRLVCWTHMPNA